MGVYFLQAGDGGPIKIGSTYDIWLRRGMLQVMNAAELKVLGFDKNGKLEQERALHERFAEHRIRGEWFHPHPDILAAAAPYFVAPPPKAPRSARVRVTWVPDAAVRVKRIVARGPFDLPTICEHAKIRLVTVVGWTEGKTIPHQYTYDRFERAVAELRAARRATTQQRAA